MSSTAQILKENPFVLSFTKNFHTGTNGRKCEECSQDLVLQNILNYLKFFTDKTQNYGLEL